MSFSSDAASNATLAVHAAVCDQVDLNDARDFDDAKRGFICALDSPLIKTSSGKTIIDLSERVTLFGEHLQPPSTVNPSLWRQTRITGPYGLFKVVDGVYQVTTNQGGREVYLSGSSYRLSQHHIRSGPHRLGGH
jgi:alkyl sulfatase BDS1-like metallo-beta-lactamase superfamily hydrolase